MAEYLSSSSPYATATAAVGTGGAATRTGVLTYEVRNGTRGWLLGVRNSVNAGGETEVAFSVLLNGVPLEDFDRIYNQVAAPENQQGNLLVRRQLPQGSTLSVVVDNKDQANTYNATAKLEIGYESI